MEVIFKNIVKLHVAAMISILGNLAVAEGSDPVSIKQLNFDLAPTAVKEIAEIKFDCTWTNNFCIKEGTEVFLMHERAGKVDLMLFFCDAFNGCGFSQNDLKASLSNNFNLSFTDESAAMYCGHTDSKLNKLCVTDLQYGQALGARFFTSVYVTESCAKTALGAKICLQGNSLYYTRATFRQKSNKEFWE